MRVPNPRLIRLGSVTRGAIIEPGDGELILSSVMQPMLELSSPVDNVFGAPAGPVDAEDSFIQSALTRQIGASAASQVLFAKMSRGAWSVDVQFAGQFTGTTAALVVSNLTLVDPDGSSAILFNLSHYNNQFLSVAHRYHFVFQRDGFNFRLNAGATVAADQMTVSASINARRLL